MYPGRPRRPLPPPPRAGMRPPMPGPVRRPSPPGQKLLSQFRDAEGNVDIDKISVTAQQVGKLYSQVGPLIGPVINKFKK
ncbi:YppG family protein [Virgibacillus kekensis]|uniref:YppG family protein n=1 Tax=Virgibacillus kekensis TaxID=202261 RepID=A0ABV9DDK7_9BACI